MGKMTNGGRRRMDRALSPPFPGPTAPPELALRLALGLGLGVAVGLGVGLGLGESEGVGELTGLAATVNVAQGATGA
jgi:hypothetical protein